MKITCPYEHYVFEGSITKVGNRWKTICPFCKSTIWLDIPEENKPILMAFVNDNDPDKDKENFTDNWKGKNIRTIYGFNTPESFMKAWREMVQKPDSMWYWVLHNGRCICSGPCDTYDEEIFIEEFGMSYPKQSKHKNSKKGTKEHA